MSAGFILPFSIQGSFDFYFGKWFALMIGAQYTIEPGVDFLISKTIEIYQDPLEENLEAGVFSLFNESFTPGRIFPAAHPHTELTTNKRVSDSFSIILSTRSAEFKSTNPTDVRSFFIGITSSSGYIILFFYKSMVLLYKYQSTCLYVDDLGNYVVFPMYEPLNCPIDYIKSRIKKINASSLNCKRKKNNKFYKTKIP